MASNAILDGFRADTELLLSCFVKQNSTRFECFCAEWNRMNFQYVFCGYMCLSEMVQFLEDAFILLKRALLSPSSHLEKIGALYLMYTMYFKQPPEQYCKFRMTLSEWMRMNQFYNEVCIFHDQASLIFWKLLQKDAFRFVEAEYEYGFERFMQKGMNDDDGSKFRRINSVIEKKISAIKDPTSGILPALQILQVGYNEMKEHIDQSSSSMATTTIATDILIGLEKIEKIFEIFPATDLQEDQSESDINTKRRQLKKKAFEGAQATNTASPKKNVSMKYRTSIIDEGEYIKISKATQVKSKKLNQLSEREIKTVIKQLEVPIEDELEESPKASTSKKKVK